jgi:hypothetical protein
VGLEIILVFCVGLQSRPWVQSDPALALVDPAVWFVKCLLLYVEPRGLIPTFYSAPALVNKSVIQGSFHQEFATLVSVARYS